LQIKGLFLQELIQIRKSMPLKIITLYVF